MAAAPSAELPQLPRDIKYLIVEHIKLPSDLKNVCLASKELKELGNAVLYKKVTINATDAKEVDAFTKSMSAAGGANLRYTRSLTLMDSARPPERPCPNGLDWEPADEVPVRVEHKPMSIFEDPNVSNAELARNMYLIVSLFPKNSLTTFRYLSPYSPPQSVLMVLYHNQLDSLEHLHIDVGRPKDLHHFNKLLTLDVTVSAWTNALDAGDDLQTFLGSIFDNQRLQNLSLASLPTIGRRNLAWQIESVLKHKPNARLSALRKLTLSNFRMSTEEMDTPEHGKIYFRLLARTIDFDLLTHLTLWDCVDWFSFCRLAMGPLGNRAPQNLKHFALSISRYEPFWGFSEIQDGLSYDPLTPLLQHCKGLESLCLQWGAAVRKKINDILINSLRDITRGLRLLSVHDTSINISGEDTRGDLRSTLDYDVFAFLCENCPNLEQLGCQLAGINDFQLLTDEESNFHPLVSLSQLSNLRTLHLRHGYSDPPLEEETTHGSNRLANYLLRTLYFLNPHNRLEALVIGQTEWHLDFNNVDEDSMKKYSTAHYCYLNAKVDLLGHETAVAVPIPSYKLWYESNYTEVMDWHMFQDDVGNWTWRQPGRFHD